MGDIFKDEEIPSLQRAIFWTEYVIRHKGADHLRSSATGMPGWKYYMLDVIGFFALCTVFTLTILYLLLRLVISILVYFVKHILLVRLNLVIKTNQGKLKYN